MSEGKFKKNYTRKFPLCSKMFYFSLLQKSAPSNFFKITVHFPFLMPKAIV